MQSWASAGQLLHCFHRFWKPSSRSEMDPAQMKHQTIQRVSTGSNRYSRRRLDGIGAVGGCPQGIGPKIAAKVEEILTLGTSRKLQALQSNEEVRPPPPRQVRGGGSPPIQCIGPQRPKAAFLGLVGSWCATWVGGMRPRCEERCVGSQCPALPCPTGLPRQVTALREFGKIWGVGPATSKQLFAQVCRGTGRRWTSFLPPDPSI